MIDTAVREFLYRESTVVPFPYQWIAARDAKK